MPVAGRDNVRMVRYKNNNENNNERRWDNGRYSFRDRSHRESHAEPAEALAPVIDHPLVSPHPPTMVATDAAMGEMVAYLRQAGSFAFDSEFIGERTYQPQLCLVQAATTDKVFLVDPLAGIDLMPLWELVASPAVEKIVLAGQQDFAPAVLQSGKAPANILDVQIAAGFIHPEYPLSLSRLILEFVGVALGKGLTFTHWDKRPLTPVQLRYAADDVRYLPAARDVICRRARELGRFAWAREESAAALEDVAFYKPLPEMFYLRVRGREGMGRRQLAILRELAIWRDRAARQENLPIRTLLKDSVMSALARHPVAAPADLVTIKDLPRPVELKYGREIVEATARGLAVPDDQCPPIELVEKASHSDAVDKLWEAISNYCTERSVAPSLAGSRKETARLYRETARLTRMENAEKYRLCKGWRKELLGNILTARNASRETQNRKAENS